RGRDTEASVSLAVALGVDACGQIELGERAHGLGRGVVVIQRPLRRAHLERLTALLVDVRGAVHREPLLARRQRNGTADLGAGASRRIHDLARRRIEYAMVERFEPDTYVLAVHGLHSPIAASASSYRKRSRAPPPKHFSSGWRRRSRQCT